MRQMQFPEQREKLLPYAFLLEKLPEMLFGDTDCPQKGAERYALPSTADAQSDVALLDFGLGLCQQPIVEVAINLVGATLQLFRRDALHKATAVLTILD